MLDLTVVFEVSFRVRRLFACGVFFEWLGRKCSRSWLVAGWGSRKSPLDLPDLARNAMRFGWWFQRFLMFTPNLGFHDPIWLILFLGGRNHQLGHETSNWMAVFLGLSIRYCPPSWYHPVHPSRAGFFSGGVFSDPPRIFWLLRFVSHYWGEDLEKFLVGLKLLGEDFWKEQYLFHHFLADNLGCPPAQ